VSTGCSAKLTAFRSNEVLLDRLIVSKGLPPGTRRISGGDYVQHRLNATYDAVKK
jgi:hypothetical protein